MATIKSYTDIEQSKKLAEILPLESADRWYWEFPTAPTYNDYSYPMFHKGEDIRNVPCWSLAALLDVLPYGYSAILTKSFDGKDYYCKIDGKTFETVANNPVDACYEMILKLHELKML